MASEAIVLIMNDKRAFVLHDEWSEQHAPSRFWEIEHVNIYIYMYIYITEKVSKAGVYRVSWTKRKQTARIQ